MKNDVQQKLPSVYPRGIFLLPSILTGVNIVLGFYSIILVLKYAQTDNPSFYFYRAGLLIVIAACFDAIDGRVARLTKTTSPFGAQLDSIADVVSFGIAPAVLVYAWALFRFERLGWIAALIYMLAGAIRLARFNVLEEIHSYSSSQYFIGLPIPAAAICLALTVMLKPDLPDNIMLRTLILVIVYGLAWLMISKCRFRSFKDIDWRRRRPVGTLVIIMILVGAVLHAPVLFLFILMFSYVGSGLMMRMSPQWMRNHFERLDTWFSGVKVLDDAETTELESDVPNDDQSEDQDPVTSSD